MNRTNIKNILALSLFLGLSTPHLCIAQEPVSKLQQAKEKAHGALSTLRQGIVTHKRKIGAGAGVIALLLASVIYKAGGVRNTVAKYNITPLFNLMAKLDPNTALIAAAASRNDDLITVALEHGAQPVIGGQHRALKAYMRHENPIPLVNNFLLCGYEGSSDESDEHDAKKLKSILSLEYPLEYTMLAFEEFPWPGSDAMPRGSLRPISKPILYGKPQCARAVLESIRPEAYPFVQGREINPGQWLHKSLQVTQEIITYALKERSIQTSNSSQNFRPSNLAKNFLKQSTGYKHISNDDLVGLNQLAGEKLQAVEKYANDNKIVIKNEISHSQ